jgi:pimeloyl-ACP methyl ester carboxylesterase
MRSWSRLLSGLATACLLVACSGSETAGPSVTSDPRTSTSQPSADADPGLAEFYDQDVHWAGCHDGFQCAKVRVPVDYADPGAADIQLAVVRLPARGGHRLGSLLVNPGGPGASGIDYARAADSIVTPAVRRQYDIVGFDPRGIGQSAPVRCLTDAQTDAWATDDRTPDNAAEETQVLAAAQQFGVRCAARNGSLIAHIGTRDAARDLDVLRAVLGDTKLNLLGKSYGTYLGATYAELFPKRVGRLVLDGVLDPAADSAELARSQAVGFQRALAAFVDDCLPRRSCPLSGDRASALGQIATMLAKTDRTPLRASRPVTQSLAVIGVANAMYDPGLWQVLREALAQAESGRGSTMLLLADTYYDRSPKGHYRTNSNDAYYAVTCLDRPQTADPTQLRARAKELAAVSPAFGAYVAWELVPCGIWPVPAEGDVAPVRATGSGPILVVGTTRDPATPYAASKALADELDAGRLLTYDGDGHTAYRQGSRCIDAAVDGYLLRGRLPAEGTRCR